MKKQLFMVVGLVITFLLFTVAETNYGELKDYEWDVEKLNQAGDLKTYENAWTAINEKYGLKVDLTNGATYDEGKLTNGGVTLDLTAPGLSGAKIVALSGGGFSISKGTKGQFEYSGNTIDFGKSAGAVEVKPNGEIILPKDATMKNEIGNTITAIQDGLAVKKEGSTTIVTGVGKVETMSGVGYIGLGEEDGTLQLTAYPCSGTTCFNFNGNNFLVQPFVGSSTSGDWKVDGLSTPILDAQMEENLQELSAKALKLESLERPEVQIKKELISHFPNSLAVELSAKLAAEQRALTSLGGHTSTFSLVKSENGVTLKPQLSGTISAPIETQSPETFSPKAFIEGTSTANALDYFTITPGGNFRADIPAGEGKTITVTGDTSSIPTFTYKMLLPKKVSEAFGEKGLIAEVTVQTGTGGIEEGLSGMITLGN